MAESQTPMEPGSRCLRRETGPRVPPPTGPAPLACYGHDVVVAWDPEYRGDPHLRAGLAVARALCVAPPRGGGGQAPNFQAIARAIIEVEKQARLLGDVRGWTESIQGAAERIAGQVGEARKSLKRQVECMDGRIVCLKAAFGGSGAGLGRVAGRLRQGSIGRRDRSRPAWQRAPSPPRFQPLPPDAPRKHLCSQPFIATST